MWPMPKPALRCTTARWATTTEVAAAADPKPQAGWPLLRLHPIQCVKEVGQNGAHVLAPTPFTTVEPGI